MDDKVIIRVESKADLQQCLKNGPSLSMGKFARFSAAPQLSFLTVCIGMHRTKYWEINVFDLIHKVDHLSCRNYEQFKMLNEKRIREEIQSECNAQISNEVKREEGEIY